jgi:two-component system sensor histidine kinase VanS
VTTKLHKSIRVRLLLDSVLSLFLTFVSEGILVTLFYVTVRSLGIIPSPDWHRMYQPQYGKQPMITMLPGGIYNHGTLPAPNVMYHHHNSLFHQMMRSFLHAPVMIMVAIIAVVIFTSFFLFMGYYLFMTRKVTRDMSRIAVQIQDIANGDHMVPIVSERDDEIGAVADAANIMMYQIQHLITKERDALQTNKDMITSLAHDLRTPLTSVIGYIELAQDVENHNEAERQKYMKTAAQNAKRLEVRIQELFQYTKLVCGETALHLQKIDFVQLIGQLVEEFYPIFHQSGMSYHLTKNVDTLMLNVDPDMLVRALQNLLGNAVKYGKEGKEVLIDLHAQKGQVFLQVVNYGRTISEESLSHIFEKYYRVEGETTSQTEGTGLGLSIARQIILLHGGDISASSEQDKISFTVVMPVR